MKLASQKPGMAFQFGNLNKLLIRGDATEDQPLFPQNIHIGIIKFITMPVSLENQLFIIGLHGNGPLLQATGIEPKSHGPPLWGIRTPPLKDLFLIDPFFQEIDNRMGSAGIEFCTIGTLQTSAMPCNFNDSTLHPKTDPEIRDLFLPSILDGLDLSFDAPRPDTSWHKDAARPFEKMFRPLLLPLFRINIFQ